MSGTIAMWKEGDRWFGAVASSQGITFLTWKKDKKELETLLEKKKGTYEPEAEMHLNKLREEISQYFQGNLKKFSVKLDSSGTAFFKSVWKEMMNIPYGKTLTYGELAQKIKNPKAMRAVGNACSQNPIPIIIPCHRVLGTGNKLNAYGFGLDEKAFLLDLEGAEYKKTSEPRA